MTPRQRTASRRSRSLAVPEFHPGQLLNWLAPWHWSGDDRPCRYCGKPTPLRDSKKHPAHKVCAEDALTKQYAEAVAEYTGGTL